MAGCSCGISDTASRPPLGLVSWLAAPVLQVTLPSEGHSWRGARARPHPSDACVCVHQCPHSTIAASPSGQLLASGALDGTVVLHDATLTTLGAVGTSPAGSGSQGGHLTQQVQALPSQQLPQQEDGQGSGGYQGHMQVGLHDATAKGVAALAFDGM